MSWLRERYAEGLEDVGCRCKRGRSRAQQRIRPRRERGRDLTRYGEHLAALLERKIGRDEGTAPLPRFDYHGGGGEPRDDSVACGETPRGGLDARRVLGHDEALLGDSSGELGVGRRIHTVDTTAEHCDRCPSHLQSASVRLAVDAPSQTADDHEARSSQLATQCPGDGGAVRRARACTYDCDCRQVEQLGVSVATREEPDGWIEDRRKPTRESRPRAAQPANALSLDGDEVCPLVELAGEPRKPRRSRLRHEMRSRLGRERGHGEVAHASSSLGTR